MLWKVIFLIVIYTIEPFIWLKSISILGWKTPNPKKSFALAFLGYYILTLTKQYAVFTHASNFFDIMTIIAITIYMFMIPIFCFYGTLSKKLLYTGMFIFSIYISELMGMFLFLRCFSISANKILTFGWFNCVCTVVTKVILYIICFFVFLKDKERGIKLFFENAQLLPLITLTVLLGIMAFSEMTNLDFHSAKNSMQILKLFLFIQAFLIAIVLYSGFILWDKKKKLFHIKEELEHKKELIEISNKLDDVRHDMSFHINMIKSFAAKKDYEKMEFYLRKAFSETVLAEEVIAFDNDTVSVLLGQTAREARKRAIRFSHKIQIQDFILEDQEICYLLSNLLKNAMDAAEKGNQRNPLIFLKIFPVKRGYEIHCINSYTGTLEHSKRKGKISKKNGNQPKVEISIIEDILNKYGGSVTTMFQENLFEICCSIPAREERQIARSC